MGMLPVKVEQLFLSNMGFAVLLKGDEDERSLPIMIGPAEAQAIALCINQIEVPRPLTHDLFKSVLDCIGCRLTRMEVCDLRAGTFFARLILEHAGESFEMDSRPSDAIALALRFGTPIFVSEEVMEKAGRVFSEEETTHEEHSDEERPEKKKSGTRRMSHLDVLKHDMSQAIAEERYEDCARLRDEIMELQKKRTRPQSGDETAQK